MHRKREQSRRLWSRGRRMQMGEAYYLGIEAGGTHLRIAAVDRTLKVCSFKKIRSEELSEAGDKAAYLESLMVPYFREMGRENCRCVCLSLASLMDRDRTVCFNSPNIRGFDNLPLKSMLEERIHIPVEMERDANTELLYEIRRLDLPREGIVAGVYIGTGLGNAVCIDGRAYRGATGSACELGHIPVAGLTEDCGCGKKGCIELKASGRNLQRIADDLHCPVGEVFIRHAEDEKVQEFITMAAIAIATEVTILDPVCVVLGGGVVGMPGFPLKTLTERVKENLRVPDPRASFKLELSSGDPEAGVVGAVINAVTLGR